jgi:hypothetical protein
VDLGALQQGLLHGGELLIGQPWRRAAGPAAVQGFGATLLPATAPDADRLGRDLELAGNLGLADTGGEQRSGVQPAGLQAITFSLCRRAARDSWHPRILARRAAHLQLNPTPKPLFRSLAFVIIERA